MVIEKIIKEYEIDKLNPRFLNNCGYLRKIIKGYKYIDVCQYWYDDPQDPERCSWIDIEGIGYGRLWCCGKIRRKFDFLQRRAIRNMAIDMLKALKENEKILAYKRDGVYHLGIMLGVNCYAEIRFSDTVELHY